MAENEDVPAAPDADATPTEVIEQPEPAPAAAVPAAQALSATRFRDTLWSFRAVVAVALATFLIGGAGGALLVAATNDDGPDRIRIGRMGPMGDGPGYRNGPFQNRPFQGDEPNGQAPNWKWRDGPPNITPPSPRSTPAPSAPQSGSTG